ACTPPFYSLVGILALVNCAAAARRWTLTLPSEIEIVFRPARLLQIGFKIGYPLPQVPVLSLELADAAGGGGRGELILAGCQRGLEASPFTVGRMSVGLGTTDLQAERMPLVHTCAKLALAVRQLAFKGRPLAARLRQLALSG